MPTWLGIALSLCGLSVCAYIVSRRLKIQSGLAQSFQTALAFEPELDAGFTGFLFVTDPLLPGACDQSEKAAQWSMQQHLNYVAINALSFAGSAKLFDRYAVEYYPVLLFVSEGRTVMHAGHLTSEPSSVVAAANQLLTAFGEERNISV